MSDDNSGNDISSAKFGEWLEGRLHGNKPDETLIDRYTAMVPAETAYLLAHLKRIWDSGNDQPCDFEKSTVFKRIAGPSATEYFTQQVHTSNSSPLNRAVGITETNVDMSPVETLQLMRESQHNNNAPYISIVTGHPNAGKTTLVALQTEIWKKDNPNGIIASNISPDAWQLVDHHITSFKDLIQLATSEMRDHDHPIAFVFDEASAHCDAKQYNSEIGEQWAPFLKKTAKLNFGMVIHLGHTLMDIHKDIRRIATEYIYKTDKKEAKVYSRIDVDSAEFIDDGLEYTMEDIPLPRIEPDPDDWAPWEWAPGTYDIDTVIRNKL